MFPKLIQQIYLSRTILPPFSLYSEQLWHDPAVFIIAHGAAGNLTRIRILNASAISNQQKALCGMKSSPGKGDKSAPSFCRPASFYPCQPWKSSVPQWKTIKMWLF